MREKDDRKEGEERVREKDDRKEEEERVREEDKGKGGEVGMKKKKEKKKKANDTRVCCMLTCFKSLCNTYFWFILIVVLSE